MQERIGYGFTNRYLWEVGDLELRAVGKVERRHVPSRPGQLDQPIEHEDERPVEAFDKRCLPSGRCSVLVHNPRCGVGPAAEEHVARAEEAVLIVDDTQPA